MYGFFAFIMIVRSEKLSRLIGLRWRLATILLLEVVAMPSWGMGLATVDSSARLIRSSLASGCVLANLLHGLSH